jgi:hypothetical protein
MGGEEIDMTEINETLKERGSRYGIQRCPTCGANCTIEGRTTKYYSPAPAPADGLLRKVLAFREGIGEYDFSDLSGEERANASDDAWFTLEAEIKTLLASNA